MLLLRLPKVSKTSLLDLGQYCVVIHKRQCNTLLVDLACDVSAWRRGSSSKRQTQYLGIERYCCNLEEV